MDTIPTKPKPTHNHLLAALSPDVQNRLFSHLELVELPQGEVVSESRQPIRYVYFPTDSIISMQYLLQDGSSTAISAVGNEGLLGVTLAMGDSEHTLSRALVQSPGHAYRLPKQNVTGEFNRHEELHFLMLRYTHALFLQVSQTAVCNRNHQLLERLCRWLLITMDRLEDNHLVMTQEFMAHMLGVRREGVTEAALHLQQMGVISYRRGSINVLDRPRLEELSCECYRTVRDETDILLDYLPQRQVIKNTEAIPTASI